MNHAQAIKETKMNYAEYGWAKCYNYAEFQGRVQGCISATANTFRNITCDRDPQKKYESLIKELEAAVKSLNEQQKKLEEKDRADK
jgi:hypothetical protein